MNTVPAAIPRSANTARTPTYELTIWNPAATAASPTPAAATTGRSGNRAATTPKTPPEIRNTVVVIENRDEPCNPERPNAAESRLA